MIIVDEIFVFTCPSNKNAYTTQHFFYIKNLRVPNFFFNSKFFNMHTYVRTHISSLFCDMQHLFFYCFFRWKKKKTITCLCTGCCYAAATWARGRRAPPPSIRRCQLSIELRQVWTGCVRSRTHLSSSHRAGLNIAEHHDSFHSSSTDSKETLKGFVFVSWMFGL